MHKFMRLNVLASAVLTSLFVSGEAHALDNRPHKIGNTNVTASLTSGLSYGDNVFRGSDTETSSTIFSLSPVIKAINETNLQKIELGYEGDGVIFFNSSDDNYLSSVLSADYTRYLSSRSEFSAGVIYEDGSTIRGTDITEGSNDDVEGATDFTRKEFSLGYAIGSAKIGPSVELGYTYTDLEFDNFSEINQGRDYTLDDFSVRFAYQYSVATQFFIDLGYSDFDYDEAAFGIAQLDNTEESISLGVKWSLSRQTSGEISVGIIDKNFDNFDDPSTLTSWNARINWDPSSRDTVTLESSSRPFEQAGTGLFQEVTETSVAWEHDLSRKLSVIGKYSYGDVEFENFDRNDDYDNFSLSLLYKIGRYSEWTLNYDHEDKDSNSSNFDFETNTISLLYSTSF